MTAAWSLVAATLLFAVMGVCVKLASAHYGSFEIVFWRGLVGLAMMAAVTRASGGTLRTRVGPMHFWRTVSGVSALCMWFYAIGGLPLATAMTLNYTSSVWMALFLVGGAVMLGSARIDGRLIAAVLAGFLGVALVLRPTIEQDQLWHGLIGMISGMVSATAYLQVGALGRAGEPEYRTVFYFSLGAVCAGGTWMLWNGPSGWHGWGPAALLLAVGLLAGTAQMLMTRAYRTGRTLVNASLQYLGIAWSFVFGVLLFGDPVTWMALAGMLLIVAAGVAAAFVRDAGHTRHADAVPRTTTFDS